MPARQQRRIDGHRLKRQESSVTEAEHTDAIGIDVTERLQVVRARRHVGGVVHADAHVNPGRPVAAVARAAAIVGRQNHVALLREVLAERVVHPIAARMPRRENSDPIPSRESTPARDLLRLRSMCFDTINVAGTGFLSRRLGNDTATGVVKSALFNPAGIESLNRTKRASRARRDGVEIARVFDVGPVKHQAGSVRRNDGSSLTPCSVTIGSIFPEATSTMSTKRSIWLPATLR